MNKFLKILISVFLLLAIFFLVPVKKRDFKELFEGDIEIENSLNRFREIPVRKLIVAGNEWNYLTEGKGEKTLLFLHGMGGAYDIWWQQIQALSNHYKVISTTLPAVHSLEGATDGLLAILNKEKIQKVSIIGSSMGGYMAQYFLQQHPERLNKLVLANTFPPNHLYREENGGIRKLLPFLPEWVIMRIFKNNVKEKVLPFSENSKLMEAYLLEQYSGLMNKKQFIGRLDVVLDYFEPEFTEAHRLVPKLIIESDNDPLIKPVLQQHLKELYPEATIFTFQKKGHFPYLNESEGYTNLLAGFLQED